MSEADMLARAKGITRDMEALTQYIAQLSVKRDELVVKLTATMSQHQIAAELGISQPAVLKMVRRGKEK